MPRGPLEPQSVGGARCAAAGAASPVPEAPERRSCTEISWSCAANDAARLVALAPSALAPSERVGGAVGDGSIGVETCERCRPGVSPPRIGGGGGKRSAPRLLAACRDTSALCSLHGAGALGQLACAAPPASRQSLPPSNGWHHGARQGNTPGSTWLGQLLQSRRQFPAPRPRRSANARLSRVADEVAGVLGFCLPRGHDSPPRVW